MAILKQAPQEHVMPNGLKKQVQLNERRFKILMRDIRNDVTRLTQNSEDLDTWIEKLGGYTSQNVFVTGPAAEEATKIVSNIMNASKFSALPRGGTQELVKGVMSENTMHYVTKMGEDMKTELRKIAVQSYDQKLAPRDIAKEMATKIDGMTEARARTIARTETMRASNLANYAHAKQMGAQSFVVTSDPNRCPLCGEVYGDGTIVFSIDQNDMIPPYHPNCYKKGTEVFTNHGWKHFKDVNDNDLILSMNPKTNETEFIPFNKKIEYHHKGEMYHLHNRWFDMAVTPDHDVYTEKRVDRGKQGRRLEPFFVKPAELHSEHRIPRTCDNNIESPEYIDVNGLHFKPEDYAFFMAWYISEGSVLHDRKNAKNRAYPIRIRQENQTQRDILREGLGKVCESVDLKLSIQKGAFEVYSKELYQYLVKLGRSHEKYIPEEVFQLSREHLNIFLDNYILGDGHERTHKNGLVKNSSERQVFTSSPKLADDLSHLILLAGYYPSFSLDNNKGKAVEFSNGNYTMNNDLYRISINKTRHATMANMTVDIIPYDDMVYCLELPKWHTLWIRSKGKTAWGGNCGCVPSYSMKSPEDLGALDTSEEVASAALAYHAEIQFDNFSKLWDQVVAETAAYA